MIPCRYFSRGICRNGDECTYLHENTVGAGGHLRSDALSFPAIDALSINPYTPVPTLSPGLPDYSLNGSSDSRALVLCKFITRPGGCKNGACPYSHNIDKPHSNGPKRLEKDMREEHEGDTDLDSTRNLSGAAVHFNDYGAVARISLPSDFSAVRITGLPSQSTQRMIAMIMRDLQFEVAAECIRIPKQDSQLETMAIVRVEDPLFALRLSDKVRQHKPGLKVTPLPTSSKPSNARKVYVSWHQSTRTVWLNFTNSKNLSTIAQRFNNGEYKISGHMVKASAEGGSKSVWNSLNNLMTGTITLSNVSGGTRARDIEASIRRQGDKPAHIEMGKASYLANNAEVSVDVRSRLEEYGPLESFYMAPAQYGKRVKATALFQDEADARSACSLNNIQMPILRKGKLTVTLVQGVKIMMSTAIYTASKIWFDQERQKWQEQHLTFHIYHDPQKQFTTVKIEGNDAKFVADARKVMDKIFCGILLTDGEKALWSADLKSNGSAYKRLKAIEKELEIVISRDKSKRQLHYHGPPDKVSQTVRRVTKLLTEEPATVHYISLDPVQFSWAIRVGFKSMQRTLGEDVAAFDVVSKSITIHGTAQQHETALDILADKRTHTILDPGAPAGSAQTDCPICFCEAESPISTSCNHTYCLECFEECCKAAASSSTVTFQVKCQGDEGNCRHIFTLRELRDSVSSSVLEKVLQSSFEDYINQHPNLFHYCPTPDCDHIYRCTATSGADRPTYTCANCLELICTSCHALHGRYTCAEYKDIQSGGYEALEQLKKELNIKDCPKCTTPMEKTEGCNHMTCGGCKAHICWVCMAVFPSSQPCYDHMTEKHGGIGLGYERFAY